MTTFLHLFLLYADLILINGVHGFQSNWGVWMHDWLFLGFLLAERRLKGFTGPVGNDLWEGSQFFGHCNILLYLEQRIGSNLFGLLIKVQCIPTSIIYLLPRAQKIITNSLWIQVRVFLKHHGVSLALLIDIRYVPRHVDLLDTYNLGLYRQSVCTHFVRRVLKILSVCMSICILVNETFLRVHGSILFHLQKTEHVFRNFSVLIKVFLVSLILDKSLYVTKWFESQVGDYIFNLSSTLKCL